MIAFVPLVIAFFVLTYFIWQAVQEDHETNEKISNLAIRLNSHNDENYKLDLNKILEFAKKKHEGQKRWNGDPYITHPIRVANSFADDNISARAIALLHDVMEDTNTSYEEILEVSNQYVADCVETLTKEKEESYSQYILRLTLSNKIGVFEVKFADLDDNLSDLKPSPRKDKYELTSLLLYFSYQIKNFTKSWNLPDVDLVSEEEREKDEQIPEPTGQTT